MGYVARTQTMISLPEHHQILPNGHTTPMIEHAILSFTKLSALPVALVAAFVARGKPRCLELLPSTRDPLCVEGKTIRVNLGVVNRTSHYNKFTCIHLTVTDALGTFTLRGDPPESIFPPDSSTSVELFAHNFHSLRLSRSCLFRARIVDQHNRTYRIAVPFVNIWPADYFDDHEPSARLDAHLVEQDILPKPYNRRLEDVGEHPSSIVIRS